MVSGINRRTFLKRTGQAGGLIATGGALEAFLAACSANVLTPTVSATPAGTVQVGNKGLLTPGQMQWGADYVDGAPYVFQDPENPKNLIGFEVEVAAAMAKLMGVVSKMVETDYGEIEQALLANHFDFILNGWTITEDRKKTEYFSDPYYRYGQQIVVRADDPRFAKLDQNSDVPLSALDGLKVGTGTGYQAVDDLATDPKIILKLYDGELPFDDLKQKKIDAVMVDLPIIAYYVLGAGPGGTKDSQLKAIGQPLFPDVYVIGFNQGNPNARVLLPEVNQALAILKQEGALKAIYQKWGLWNDQQAAIGIV